VVVLLPTPVTHRARERRESGPMPRIGRVTRYLIKWPAAGRALARTGKVRARPATTI
jgi:hypothetical protein